MSHAKCHTYIYLFKSEPESIPNKTLVEANGAVFASSTLTATEEEIEKLLQ